MDTNKIKGKPGKLGLGRVAQATSGCFGEPYSFCLESRCARFISGPVMPRRGSYFLLLVQKKVTQEKDTPVRRSPVGRLPCVAHRAGRRARTRAIRYAATRSDNRPPTAPGAAALLGGSQGPQKRRGACRRAAFHSNFLFRSTPVSNRAICSAGILAGNLRYF